MKSSLMLISVWKQALTTFWHILTRYRWPLTCMLVAVITLYLYICHYSIFALSSLRASSQDNLSLPEWLAFLSKFMFYYASIIIAIFLIVSTYTMGVLVQSYKLQFKGNIDPKLQLLFLGGWALKMTPAFLFLSFLWSAGGMMRMIAILAATGLVSFWGQKTKLLKSLWDALLLRYVDKTRYSTFNVFVVLVASGLGLSLLMDVTEYSISLLLVLDYWLPSLHTTLSTIIPPVGLSAIFIITTIIRCLMHSLLLGFLLALVVVVYRTTLAPTTSMVTKKV